MNNANINSIWHTPYGHRTYHFFYTIFSILFYVKGRILIVFMTHGAGRTRCPCGPPFAHPCLKYLLILCI